MRAGRVALTLLSLTSVTAFIRQSFVPWSGYRTPVHVPLPGGYRPILVRTIPVHLTGPPADDPPEHSGKGWYGGYRQYLSRLASSYREGYQRSRESFTTPRPTDVLNNSDGVPLRPADRVAALLLTLLLCEAACFGVALVGAWAVVGVPVGAARQARLHAATQTALSIRTATRVPRLLVQFMSLPCVASMIRSRKLELRATFVKERATQTLAVLAAVALTLRACNTLLIGYTSSAAATLSGMAGGLPVGGAIATGVCVFVSNVVMGAWRWLGAVDAAARAMATLRPLYALADMEERLAPAVRLLAASISAFFHEVVAPLLRTVGFLTVQTLG
jgi:hypothetical protein